jgi:hypothetical protein
LEQHTISIFRAEAAMLGSGGIYIGMDEWKAEGVGQSEMRNEGGEGTGPNLQAGIRRERDGYRKVREVSLSQAHWMGLCSWWEPISIPSCPL